MMIAIFRLKLFSAPPAVANLRRTPILPPAMSVKGCGAIGTDDPQVLKPVVIRHSIDVIEDQRHRLAAPVFVLTAHLAAPLLQTLQEETLLQLVSGVSRALH
jgi:hypothetical protein